MTEPTKKKSICGCSMCEFHTTAYEIAVERGDIVDEPSAGAVQTRQTTTSELGEILREVVTKVLDHSTRRMPGEVQMYQMYVENAITAIEQKYIRRDLVIEAIPKKVEEYPINVIDRSTNSRIDTNLTHGLAPRDRGYNQAIDDFRQTLNLEPKENK